MIDMLDDTGKPAHVVFGNIDDRHLTTRKADEADAVELHGNEANVEFDEITFYVTHFPDVARLAAESGEYDVVVHGHTHEQRRERVGDCLLVNPGELLGRQEKRGYGTYDTNTMTLELHRLDD
jgi:putative phosphoesterase